MAAPSSAVPTLGRPPLADLAWLGVAVVFISSSGPIIAATVAPALAIAFWRCLLGSAFTAPWVLLRRGWTSTTRPVSRGGLAPMRSTTMASRTLPT